MIMTSPGLPETDLSTGALERLARWMRDKYAFRVEKGIPCKILYWHPQDFSTVF
jgi:hypothetical protein